MNAYKGKQKNSTQLQELKQCSVKDNDIFDPSISLIAQKTTNDNPNCDLIPVFMNLQSYVSTNSIDLIHISLIDLAGSLESFIPDDKTLDYLINSNITATIITILQHPVTYENYQITIYLILKLFQFSVNFEKPEIFNNFNNFTEFNLLDFLLTKINPNYKKEPNQPMDLIKSDLNLLPTYLQILSFYCFLTNKDVCDMIIQIVIQPNVSTLFGQLFDTELTCSASQLVSATTRIPLNEKNLSYINWIIEFSIKNIENMDSSSQFNFLEAINNMAENPQLTTHLFNFKFEIFLENFLSQNILSFSDSYLNVVLQLQLKMLIMNPPAVPINYPRLIEIGNSLKYKISKKVAFDLFREALKLREKDAPLDDEKFFMFCMNIFRNGSFDIKTEFVKILDVWIIKCSKKIVVKRATIVMDEIVQILPMISVSDQLFFVVLNEIRMLLEIAVNNSFGVIDKLKEIIGNNNAVCFLEEVQKDEEANEAVLQLAQEILNYFVSDQPD